MATPHKSGLGKRVAFAGLATILFFVLVEVGFRLVISATSDRLVHFTVATRETCVFHSGCRS